MMNWLKSIRRNLLLRNVCEENTVSHELFARLSKIEVSHLKKIAIAHHRIKTNVRSLTWVFPSLLPLMLDDVGVASEVGKAKHDEFVAILNKRIVDAAKKILNGLPDLISFGPSFQCGCSLNYVVLLEATIEHMRNGKSVRDIGTQLTSQVQADTRRFFIGYDVWLKEQAERVFCEVEPTLEETVPKGCKLNRTWCLEQLEAVLNNNNKDLSKAISAFAELFRKTQSSAYLGYAAALGCRLGDAHTIWDRVKAKLKNASDVSFKEDEILKSIAGSLVAGESFAGIENQLVTIITFQLEMSAKEKEYAIFRSGNTHQICRSESRASNR